MRQGARDEAGVAHGLEDGGGEGRIGEEGREVGDNCWEKGLRVWRRVVAEVRHCRGRAVVGRHRDG